MVIDSSTSDQVQRQGRVIRYLRAVTSAAANITSRLDLEHVLRTVVETQVADFDAVLARIWLYEPTSNTLQLRASAGLSTRIADSSRARIDVATYPYKVGVVARTRQPFVKNGLVGDPEFEQEWVERERLLAVAAFPLLIAGELRGVLVHFSRQALPEEVVEALAAFVTLVTTTLNDVHLFERAQEAIQVRDDFLSVASHELKTPLTTLQGHLQLLLRTARHGQLPEPPELVRRLELAEQSTRRLVWLINRLLDVSRISTGPLGLDRQTVDLSAVAREVTANFETRLREAGCQLVLSADQPVLGNWDRLRIEQMLASLLTNAVKYGPGKPVEVAVSADGQTARVQIRDHGIGVTPEQCGRIFARFERAVSSRNYGGLGLGLYLVQRIVEAHGGTIQVQGEPGAGSTFTVELPTS